KPLSNFPTATTTTKYTQLWDTDSRGKSTARKQGQRGCRPFPLHPQSLPNLPPLRSGQFRLTIPNTYSTITMSASRRSDCCSPSLRNAVRLPSGINVHLHRNTHERTFNNLRRNFIVEIP